MARELIRMNSTGLTEKGKPTGYFYTTDKSKTNTPNKFEKIYFDPRAYNKETGKCGMHVIFKEGKIK